MGYTWIAALSLSLLSVATGVDPVTSDPETIDPEHPPGVVELLGFGRDAVKDEEGLGHRGLLSRAPETSIRTLFS